MNYSRLVFDDYMRPYVPVGMGLTDIDRRVIGCNVQNIEVLLTMDQGHIWSIDHDEAGNEIIRSGLLPICNGFYYTKIPHHGALCAFRCHIDSQMDVEERQRIFSRLIRAIQHRLIFSETFDPAKLEDIHNWLTAFGQKHNIIRVNQNASKTAT